MHPNIDPSAWADEDVRPGRVAYEGYYRCRAGIIAGGDRMWTWDEMVQQRPEIALAWMDAALAAINDHITHGAES